MNEIQRGWRMLFLEPSALSRDWGLSVSLIFEPRDLWVGVYWNATGGGIYDREIAVYVCFLPCLPIRLTWWRFSDEIPF